MFVDKYLLLLYNIEKRMVKIMELNDLRMYKHLCKLDSTLANQVQQVYNLTFETINSISRSFDNYTMHDMNHGLRVATYMEQLAFGIDDDFDKRMSEFNALELSLMILSAILHDIGMTIRDEDKTSIKNNNIKYSDSLTFEGVMKVVENNEDEAIKEIIRRTHASRIYEFINYGFSITPTTNSISNILLVDNNYPYAEDVAEICKAHGEEHKFLETLRTDCTKGTYTFNSQYIAALLRIADYLDLDRQRTPILWFSLMELKGFSRDEWEKHFVIQNVSKLKSYIEPKLQIYFDGKSANAKIHRKYLRYIDDLKVELENTDELLNTKTTIDKYKFNICTKIDDRVETEGFTYSDLRLTLDYSAITNLLMGQNIYGDCRLGLRELIQNAIDSCELMKEIGEKDSSAIIVEPSITIAYSKSKNYVKIKDTGIGMTLDVVKKHFLNVGKSYYKSNEFLFKNHSYKPIGQYGIGFLACFLLSDNITVKTKYYLNNEINQIELEKNSEYVVTTSQQTPNFLGTEITLDYSKFFEIFKNEENLKRFVENYFYTKTKITLINEDETEKTDIKNRCNENLNIYLQTVNTKKSKCSTIDISSYSENIEGKIIIRKKLRTTKCNIEDVDITKSFLYNRDNNTINQITSSTIFESNYYVIIKYTLISEADYNDIKSKKHRDDERFCDAIIAYSKEKEKQIDIYITRKDFNDIFSGLYFDFEEIEDDSEIIKIKEIFENSNLPFYATMLSYYNHRYLVYVDNGKSVHLKYNHISSYHGLLASNEIAFKNSNTLYHKGILVPNFGHISIQTPFEIEEIRAYILNKSLPIKLDVSRNSIIEGAKILNAEISKVILMSLIENEKDKEVISIVQKMIETIDKL